MSQLNNKVVIMKSVMGGYEVQYGPHYRHVPNAVTPQQAALQGVTALSAAVGEQPSSLIMKIADEGLKSDLVDHANRIVESYRARRPLPQQQPQSLQKIDQTQQQQQFSMNPSQQYQPQQAAAQGNYYNSHFSKWDALELLMNRAEQQYEQDLQKCNYDPRRSLGAKINNGILPLTSLIARMEIMREAEFDQSPYKGFLASGDIQGAIRFHIREAEQFKRR